MVTVLGGSGVRSKRVHNAMAKGWQAPGALTAEPHMDSASPTGRLLRNIFASVAEYEREMIRGRILAGLRRAWAQGKA